jgi:hypothetical protein
MLGDSNLMFVYDTGDVANSYLGEPTTNLATFNIASSTFNTDAPGNLTQTANSSEATFQGRLSRKMVVGDGYWNAYVYGYNTGVSSTNFAISYKVKTSDNSHPSTVIGGGYIYGSAGTFFPGPTFTYLSDGWYLATILYSGTSMTLNSLTGMYGYGPKTFYITDYQAEAKSNSTPYAGVSGTRSISGSLFDISGNRNTISLINMSYDSNSQPYFDGTDDYFTIPSSPSWAIGLDGTIETIIYRSAAVTTNHRIWCVNNNSTNLDAYLDGVTGGLYMHGGTVGTNAQTPLNQYLHVVATYDSGVVSIYYNAIPQTLTGTTTGYNITNTGTLYIGEYQGGGPYYFNGKIPLFKIYNRSLSAQEVYNNYNEYKTRFNLT